MSEDTQKLNALLDFDLLKKLVVGIGEVSEITGIPTRKIRYWEEKGAIQSESGAEGSTRRYDYLNVKKMLLIQEMMDEGFTLDAAIKKVEKRMVTLNEAFRKLADTVPDTEDKE
ncbi:MerR family transcriptional regulator [Pseudogracilibacillus auburnensis]|uniref:MerR-like DNA binding protein n=1 Tax=Pseudogracilibacillus auburnensis TaxID=1494959 RepID=A0A2V3WBM4_9BACI|nr:MerR family transcriptional regulator [Pseudogracilibacillus auburnensis]PXW90421.1 MerR-like DNA binding protein [Pseudogracilibacillus auburnensis]